MASRLRARPLRFRQAMRTAFFLRSFAASALVGLLSVACGGRALGTRPTPDGDAGPTADSAPPPTNQCVTVDLSTYDHSCVTDNDCTLARGGTICTDQCSCGSTPINVSGEARYQTALAGLQLEDCQCGFPGVLRCVENSCTLCTGDLENDPPGCRPDQGLDAGPPVFDVGVPDVTIADAAVPDVFVEPDGNVCVAIDVSTYDTACTEDSDCIEVNQGAICTGSCLCGGASINKVDQGRYSSVVNEISTELCPCASWGPPVCNGGKCASCQPGPNRPAKCP
jgi:hypothetical protein